MSFNSDLIVTDEGYGKSKLVEPLSYTSERLDRVFCVPVNFITDYASIPRLLQLFISKLGRHRKAAVIHDYLYNANSEYLHLTRKECDLVFYDAMIDANVPRWKAYTMYQAVRVGGWASFRKLRKG